MLTVQEAARAVILICLEEFLYSKISVLCALTCTLAAKGPNISRSRNLFRNIRYIFTMSIKGVQDGNYRFLCSLFSLRFFIIAVSNNSIRKNMIF